MPHAARHSRPRARRQDEAHALGSLLDTLHSPSDLVPPATAHRHSSQPEYTAPPSPLPPSSRIHAASVGLLAEDEELSGRQRPEQQAPASARTAAQPHPPPEPPPAAPPAGAGAGAGDMSGDAAPRHRTVDDTLRDMRSLIEADITEELAMDLLSRLHIMQQTLLQQIQRAHARRNPGEDEEMTTEEADAAAAAADEAEKAERRAEADAEATSRGASRLRTE